MLVKLTSAGIDGIDAFPVEVEVDVRRCTGEPRWAVVGLPGASVKESRDRVEVAVRNTGFALSASIVTINLAPADRRKEGPAFELPMAIGLLGGSELLPPEKATRYMIIGELGLDGSVRPVPGCLPMALECRKAGLAGVLCPKENAREAAVVADVDVIPVESLRETFEFLRDMREIAPVKVDLDNIFHQASKYHIDFNEVKGQYAVKRALTVAAAGGHNCLLVGSPGGGKSMIAKRLPTILPDLTLEESLETTKIYSVAGRMAADEPLMATRPFRSPHHSVSMPGLIGGGSYPKPGEISLAHHGVLFLDELPEFQRSTLEALRAPIEDGVVTISRAQTSVSYPAEFMLIAAMNPCPCGYRGDPKRKCRCSDRQIEQYVSRISGPLMDRIDIHLDVPPVEFVDLRSRKPGESSENFKRHVSAARAVQAERFKGQPVFCNARMRTRHLETFCRLNGESEALLEQAMTHLGLSARAYVKVLRVSRTIADLDGSPDIKADHLSEAIQYRSLDRLGTA